MRVRVMTAVALGAVGTAEASVIQFEFKGNVTAVSGSFAGTPFAGAANGDAYTLVYTFESATPDSIPDGSLGVYDNAMLSMSLQIGAGVSTAFTSGDIETANNFVNSFDAYQIDAGLQGGIDVGMLLQDMTQAAFGSDALPTDLVLSAFATKLFTVEGPNGSMSGDIKSFGVPAPGAAGVVLAAGALGMRRRR